MTISLENLEKAVNQLQQDFNKKSPNIRFERIDNKDLLPVTANLKNAEPATAGNYGRIFTALRPYEVIEVVCVFGTASTSGTLNVERLQGTEALDAGDTILTTNFDLSSTANTPQYRKAIDGQIQNSILSVGDRLALKDGGTLTNQVDLQVTILLKPLGKGDYR